MTWRGSSPCGHWAPPGDGPRRVRGAGVRLVFLGTGGPIPDPARHGPALVVTRRETLVMVDAGRGAARQLVLAGLDPGRLDAVVLTHLHLDHISDLGDVLISSWLMGRRGAIQVVGPPGTAGVVDALVTGVYGPDIAIRSREPLFGDWPPVTVREVEPGESFRIADLTFEAGAVVHGQGLFADGEAAARWVTLGYRVAAGGRLLALSGDTIRCPGLESLARGADLLVMCCYIADVEVDNEHRRRVVDLLLASSSEAGRAAAAAGVPRVALTHFRRTSAEMVHRMEQDVRAVFGGDVIVAEDLLAVDV